MVYLDFNGGTIYKHDFRVPMKTGLHEVIVTVVNVEHYLCRVLCFQVSVDVFKGFPDEDSIVNYTLNQAYQDNVSVFASESSLCVRLLSWCLSLSKKKKEK